ncbi:AT-rich interactive domain-containing protein 2-like [Culex pipiens pallens]|uniref:AT-rich interactive domain-containing protein 2-like n=1 Tax=Culex pipiens pallens TaxID=42434 RepID=UPI0022AAC0A9|nr:AT-rich interactive domain-containing protein 2-like [Culex pipiens pallens]
MRWSAQKGQGQLPAGTAAVPRMRGRNVDSHRLYWVVVARDWWLKVNSREDWGEIIEEMALPKRCVNNEIALKKINFRFL